MYAAYNNTVRQCIPKRVTLTVS